ncbi:MEKHLA domain-containing protein [Actinacidiphila guanduensis]|uniref:MEKHLA domain-containing protein n=1 Tax=Actinacidiphila guanduensis TaxID=310781 RepID=A0A1H0S2H9_9ACTN|nr:MEKHLA domain-containing protein [Actinacidiphila guanduensis]
MMDVVRAKGYVDGYRGQRRSKQGKRFWIEDVTIWNLSDRSGPIQGQAALIATWSDVGKTTVEHN